MAKSTFSPRQKKLLLSIILVLLIVRFGVVPVIDYQQAQKSTLELTTTQLERAEGLLEDENIQIDKDAIANDLSFLENKAYGYRNGDTFTLSVQKRIEKVAKAESVNILVFNWISESSELDGYLMLHQGQVQVDGAVPDIARLQMQLAKQLFGFKISEFRIQPKRGTVRRGDMNVPLARASLIFQVVGIRKEES